MDELIPLGVHRYFRYDIPFMLPRVCTRCRAILNRAIPLHHEHIHTDFISGGV
jgi:hypothetical protein